MHLFVDLFAAPPDAQILHLLGGAVSPLGGRAPPGVWVIPTLTDRQICYINIVRRCAVTDAR